MNIAYVIVLGLLVLALAQILWSAIEVAISYWQAWRAGWRPGRNPRWDGDLAEKGPWWPK